MLLDILNVWKGLLTATDQTVDSDTHPSEHRAAFLPILFQSILAAFPIRINDPPAEISRGSATFTAKPSLVSTEECFPPFKCIKCATQRPNVPNSELFQSTLAEIQVTYLFINKGILQHLPTYITFLAQWKVNNAQWG